MSWIAAVVVSTLLVADAAAPTDYRTTVVAVTPATDSIEVEVVGGDAFLQLTADPGTTVMVVGYEDEPYLRFRADGVVLENQRSPTTYLNESRYGTTAPPGADPALPPDWLPVGSGGRYAWHDHRAHWMSQEPPEHALRGDRILESAIPLRVDGVDVSVEVATDWLHRPSRVPLYVGAGIAAGLVAVALVLRRRVAWVLLAVAVAAAGIGWWEYASLPSETGPLSVWWLLPGRRRRVGRPRPRPGLPAGVVRPRAARRDRARGMGGDPSRRRLPRPHPDGRPVLARPRRPGGRVRCRGGRGCRRRDRPLPQRRRPAPDPQSGRESCHSGIWAGILPTGEKNPAQIVE